MRDQETQEIPCPLDALQRGNRMIGGMTLTRCIICGETSATTAGGRHRPVDVQQLIERLRLAGDYPQVVADHEPSEHQHKLVHDWLSDHYRCEDCGEVWRKREDWAEIEADERMRGRRAVWLSEDERQAVVWIVRNLRRGDLFGGQLGWMDLIERIEGKP